MSQVCWSCFSKTVAFDLKCDCDLQKERETTKNRKVLLGAVGSHKKQNRDSSLHRDKSITYFWIHTTIMTSFKLCDELVEK